MTMISGWRLALRLAWRDAWRSRSRSLLALVLVTLPVVAVVAADVAQATSSVSSQESLPRRMGTAQALVTAFPAAYVLQSPDPATGVLMSGPTHAPVDLAGIQAAMGQRPTTELRSGLVAVSTDLGLLDVQAHALDLTNPLTHGMYRLTAGRYPSAPDEVLVNRALAQHGFGIGDRIRLQGGAIRHVVGTAESTDIRSQPLLIGSLGSLPPPGAGAVRTWLVGGAPIDWHQVLAANRAGIEVISRDVLEHPPPLDQVPARIRSGLSSQQSEIYVVLALIAVMTLIEVVLLAGPAFAVGARRQSRDLALLAANGGTPAQSRRVVLGAAVVVGATGALVGVALGILIGRLIVPALQSMSGRYFGPFQIRWSHVLVIAAFGLISALLAAVVPAWIASRQDVVAVLAGRRGDRAPSRRSPFIGLVLLAMGVLGAVLGAHSFNGELMVAGSAVVSVLGMLFLVPTVVVMVARLGRRLPLSLRYAVRDAARHRTRTTPAVAAVAATVAGVVALSIGSTSDQAQARADYTAQLPLGMASVVSGSDHPDWPSLQAAVEQTVPGHTVSPVPGISTNTRFAVHVPGGPSAMGVSLDTPYLVSDGRTLPLPLQGFVSPGEWARAAPVLGRGGVMLFSDGGATGLRSAQVRVIAGRSARRLSVPAIVVAGPGNPTPSEVISPSVARRLGVPVTTAGLIITGPTLTTDEESRLQQVLNGQDHSSYLYVERGYETPGSEKVVLWILFGLGLLLMLGGTLTATFLALSDARPDLATLSAVGASPRTRRGVAASYALSVGAVGALLGAAVGFIPGIAVSYPLTRSLTGTGPSHYLEIPWLQILGLVLALPLLTATVVGLLARSRLPMVARLD
jgi:putative ABC transport system permease protein